MQPRFENPPGYPACTAARYPARTAWAAFAVAFVLHLAVVLVVHHYQHPELWENGSIAQNMLDGNGYAISFAGPNFPTAWQAPGYPFELFLFEKTLGQTPTTYFLISLVQCIGSAAMTFPIAWLAFHWFGSRAAAFSAWIVAFMPLYAWYCTRIHQASDVMAFYPWILAGWFLTARSKKMPTGIATGLLTGLGALFSPTMLAVFGVISFVLLLRAILTSNWHAATVIFVAGLCTLAAVTPWTVRNYRVFGRIVPIKDSFPKELWYGNNPDATGTPFFPGGEAPIDLPAEARQYYGTMKETDLMDFIKKKTFAYISSDKPGFAQRTAKKVLWLWTAVPRNLLRNYGGAEAVRFYWVHTGYWMLFLLAFIAALFLSLLRRFEIVLSFATIIPIYSTVYGLTIVGNARFRAEIEFLFIPVFAAVCIILWDRFFKGRRASGE